jgi:hypothetical protein
MLYATLLAVANVREKVIEERNNLSTFRSRK